MFTYIARLEDRQDGVDYPRDAAAEQGETPPPNRLGAGHERIDRQGYVVMIVEEPNPYKPRQTTRPVHKHRYLWEQKNGQVPAGYVLKCLDGDLTNCDPENWGAVPRGVLSRLNGPSAVLKYGSAPDELKPTLVATARLKQAIRELERRS